mmetsp:Transcript_12675/g.36272  ORF Transcript_12675/g.36272 Transcript_12675/m.36272 type:complete len:267 (-) Transcript_12675:362-1162(-)
MQMHRRSDTSATNTSVNAATYEAAVRLHKSVCSIDLSTVFQPGSRSARIQTLLVAALCAPDASLNRVDPPARLSCEQRAFLFAAAVVACARPRDASLTSFARRHTAVGRGALLLRRSSSKPIFHDGRRLTTRKALKTLKKHCWTRTLWVRSCPRPWRPASSNGLISSLASRRSGNRTSDSHDSSPAKRPVLRFSPVHPRSRPSRRWHAPSARSNSQRKQRRPSTHGSRRRSLRRTTTTRVSAHTLSARPPRRSSGGLGSRRAKSGQ